MVTISAHQIIRDGVKYHFPFIESFLAVEPIVDEFVFCEGFSTDGTYEKLLELQKQYPNKIKIFREKWYETNPKWMIFADLTNRCIEKCQSTWHWQIEGDEIYHEKDLSLIKQLTEDKEADWYSFGMHRLCYNTFDKICNDRGPDYNRNLKRIKMARKSTYPYIHNPKGFTLQDVLGNYKGKDVSDKIKIFHYSYTRHPKVFQLKANFMMKTYFTEDKRFSGDKPPEYLELWSEDKTLPFTQPHPAVMKNWMDQERKGE